MIGGNYWGTPTGTGFSDVTPDRDADGFVDGLFVLPGGIGTDSLPLGPSLSSPTGAMTTMPAVTIDTTALQAESNQAAVDSGAAANSTSTGVEGNAGTITTREATGSTASATLMAGNGATAATPTAAPGFGAIVALVGIGAVAALVLRRE
jgi:PGF-CTERM protein